MPASVGSTLIGNALFVPVEMGMTGDRRPPERDSTVRAVATEHDDGGTPDFAHRTRRSDRVAHVVMPGRDEVFDEVIELDGLGRTAHDPRPVAEHDDSDRRHTARRRSARGGRAVTLSLSVDVDGVGNEPADVSSRGRDSR